MFLVSVLQLKARETTGSLSGKALLETSKFCLCRLSSGILRFHAKVDQFLSDGGGGAADFPRGVHWYQGANGTLFISCYFCRL